MLCTREVLPPTNAVRPDLGDIGVVGIRPCAFMPCGQSLVLIEEGVSKLNSLLVGHGYTIGVFCIDLQASRLLSIEQPEIHSLYARSK